MYKKGHFFGQPANHLHFLLILHLRIRIEYTYGSRWPRSFEFKYRKNKLTVLDAISMIVHAACGKHNETPNNLFYTLYKAKNPIGSCG